jgi:uncharacterized protein
MNDEAVVDATRRWIASMVIGLNLCPFAQRVFNGGLIRYVVTNVPDEESLLRELTRELESLASASITDVETTLLIHPNALEDFLDYNDFLGEAERSLRRLGLEGVIQVASFHPRYQFADTQPDDAENYTNRSPYPMLHLLREESITRVADDPDALNEIPRQNIDTLRRMGVTKIQERLKESGGPES